MSTKNGLACNNLQGDTDVQTYVKYSYEEELQPNHEQVLTTESRVGETTRCARRTLSTSPPLFVHLTSDIISCVENKMPNELRRKNNVRLIMVNVPAGP